MPAGLGTRVTGERACRSEPRRIPSQNQAALPLIRVSRDPAATLPPGTSQTDSPLTTSPAPTLFDQHASTVPYADIDQAQCVEAHGSLVAILQGKTAAVGRPAERRRPIMNEAATAVEIHALPAGLVRQHESSSNKRMRLRPVLPGRILPLKSDEISLATEGAAVTGNVSPRHESSHRYPVACCS